MEEALKTLQENFGNKEMIKPDTLKNLETFRSKLIDVRDKLQHTKDQLEEKTKNMPGVKRKKQINTAMKVCPCIFIIGLLLYIFFIRKQRFQISLVSR